MQGQYDRVHVGASCPPDRLSALLSLLQPGGGKIVTPVSPSDMRVITVDGDGNISQRVISQVRYSELEVGPPCLPTPTLTAKLNIAAFGFVYARLGT